MKLLLILLTVGCATLEFKDSGKIPVYLEPKRGHHRKVEVSGVKEFFFWGQVPKRHVIFLDDIFQQQAVESVANVKTRSYRTFESWFKSIVSFGLFTPVNYQITAFADAISKE